MTATAKPPPIVALPTYAPADQQSNFLTFLGKYVPEDPVTAKAYYKAIDPLNKKVTFPQWLVKAGFIGQESDWRPTGKQDIRTGQPVGVYGPNIINTDSRVIVINDADLGFVRNQFIRCKPSCTASNPIIYTYLENYPVSTADQVFGFPTPAEAKAAILNADNNRTDRLADVAFEWAPPPDGSAPKNRYGQLYAYVFHKDSVTGAITESRNWFDDPAVLSQLNSRANDAFPPLHPIVAGDPFAPELDARGFKQHPGVCFMCHGGAPQALTSSGLYPRKGNVPGFKFLPLDIPNLLFTSDNDANDPLSRAAQEDQIKRYNQAVLITHGASRSKDGLWRVPMHTDDQGVWRTTHAIETILGWYGGLTMPSPTQNTEFVPAGWREAAHGGTAPAGSEALYLKSVAPACRSCHFQRGIDADFGTVKSFDANKSDILELVLKPECKSDNPPPGKRVMPAARRTFDRFWLGDQDEYIKAHFGFTSTSYCSQPH
ncbi:MAG: hypothetical protein WA056_06745 [Gallionella sp.]